MNVSQAKDKLQEATNAVALANQNLTDAREAVSYGEATERDTFKAARQVDRAQAKEAQARADLTVATRLEEAETARQKAEAARIAGELRRIAEGHRDAERTRYRSWLTETRTQAQEFDQRLKGFSVQLRELGAGQYPSRWPSWRSLILSIDDQLGHTPAPRAIRED